MQTKTLRDDFISNAVEALTLSHREPDLVSFPQPSWVKRWSAYSPDNANHSLIIELRQTETHVGSKGHGPNDWPHTVGLWFPKKKKTLKLNNCVPDTVSPAFGHLILTTTLRVSVFVSFSILQAR